MKVLSFKICFLIIPVILICGCVSEGMIKGSEKGSEGKIKIFTTPPQRSHQVISVINASKSIDDYSSIEAAEKAALESLEYQAKKVGADGIMDVYIELLENGELVSSAMWRSEIKSDYSQIESAVGGGCGFSQSINLRGKALRFVD
ncbi:MAG: hypothetical protein ACMUIM_05805 [bacterium]